MRWARLATVAGALFLLANAAADPADQLKNPAQEARARALFREIRCVVCQSESIDESDASLARDLRQLIRQQVAAGKTDDQIRAFLVSRYGQFVLLTPKASLGNAILWVGHGYLYLTYVIVTLQLGVRLRWPILRLLLVMAAGTIPTMSFLAEHFVTRDARASGAV